MPREVVTLQVGQCGNQIGWRFWDLVLREHASAAKDGPGAYDDCMSTFFRNWDIDSGRDLRPGRSDYGPVPIKGLRARAILVDTEEGVVSQLLRSPLGPLFDHTQMVTDVSGAGNNWAHGYYSYGPQYRDALMEQVRRSLEACESPQSFFIMHSLGGGTGSGLGTFIVEQLADEHPELYRFSTALFPSAQDDVVTSPYNFGLAIGRLAEAADCILPLENQAMADIVAAIGAKRSGASAGGAVRMGGAVAPTSGLDYCPPFPAGVGAVDRLQFGGNVWGSYASSATTSGASISSSSTFSAATARRTLGSGSRATAASAPRIGLNSGSSGSMTAFSSEDYEDSALERSLAAADALLSAASLSGALDARGPQRTVSHATAYGSARGHAPPATMHHNSSSGVGRLFGDAPSAASRVSTGSGRGSVASSSRLASTPKSSSISVHPSSSRIPQPQRRHVDAFNDDGYGHDEASASESGFDPSIHVAVPKPKGRAGTAWDGMNNLAAHLLTHLTASMRFEGPLNVDLNEITTTLVPFASLNLLQASITPLAASADLAVQASPRVTAAMFNDAFTRGHQLIRGDPRSATHLAVGLLLRGDIALSDVQSNVERLKREIPLARWNPDGFKVGLCAQPPLHQANSLLALSNNTSLAAPLQAGLDRFAHLYRMRAHAHHYTQFSGDSEPHLFDDAMERLAGLVDGYRQVEALQGRAPPVAATSSSSSSSGSRHGAGSRGAPGSASTARRY